MKRVEQIQTIVEAAGLAPSGDNCQPWLFAWNGEILSITHDEARGRHSLNRQNHASYLSLGTVLESIQIAATAVHLKASWNWDETKLSRQPYAEVRFQETSETADPLHTAIAQRMSDRRPYQGGSLKEPFFKTILDSSRSFPQNHLYFSDHYSDELMTYLKSAECFVIEHKDAHKDVFHWLRFNEAHARETRDGLPWQNLGMTYVESRVLALCTDYRVQSLMNKLIFRKVFPKNLEAQLKSSAGVGCITVSSKRLVDLVDAGRLWFRTWCALNAQGYGFQPMTSAVFPVYDLATGAFPKDKIRPDYYELFEKGREILKRAFGFSTEEIPVVLFRTGKSNPLPESCRRFHLPIDQIFKVQADK